MYRRRREKRRKLIQSFTLWHPMILLFLMFVLGACTHSKAEPVPMPTSAAIVSEAAESSSVPQASKAAAQDSPSIQEGVAELPQESLQELPKVEAAQEAYQQALAENETTAARLTVNEAGNYTSRDEVALYLHIYDKLPSNYITKKKAESLGWDSKKGNLEEILPGMSIGGSTFGNYEWLLPAKSGRKYYECDIDYAGGYRNAKRIIYSNDGLIFYTEDHYKSFEQLY